MKKIGNKKLEIILLGIIFLLAFVVNTLTPLLTDDFSYAYYSNSFEEIFRYQIWHYLNWGGRSVAHTLAQIFLFFPKWVFNIMNSLMQVMEVFLIYKIAQEKKKRNPILLVVIFLLLWFVLPVFGVSNIWLIGSCNYLWTTVIILFFIFQFLKEKEDTSFHILGMLLLGILAGWTNENTSFGCLVTVCGLLIIQKMEKKKIPKWSVFGVMGNGIGFSIMILAPGNFIRSEVAMENKSFLMRILSRGVLYTENLVTYLLPLIILLTILLSIYHYKRKKINLKIYPFIIGSILTVYSMLLSPQFPERAWTGVIILGIIPIVMLLWDLPKVSKKSYYGMMNLIIIGMFLFIKEYLILLTDVNQLRVVWNQRELEIKEIIESNQDTVEWERYYPITKKSPMYDLADVEEDSEHWSNKNIAQYYGIKEVKQKTNES